jgi:protein-S-isoprenylcysteine O-methyltransferase Ste14
MTHAIEICGDLWLVWFAGWMVASLWTKRAAEHVDLMRQLSYGVPVVLGFGLLFSNRISLAWLSVRLLPHSAVKDLAGVVLTIAGLSFATWARVHLGRNWSSAPMIKEGHQLIRTGPYRLVRHPIYTGLLLSAMGTFLVNAKVRGLLGVVILYLAFVIKSRIEEGFMVRTFGAEYEDYRRTTGAILPRMSF